MVSRAPKFWPLDTTRNFWFAHLDATVAEATGNLTGNYNEITKVKGGRPIRGALFGFFSRSSTGPTQ